MESAYSVLRRAKRKELLISIIMRYIKMNVIVWQALLLDFCQEQRTRNLWSGNNGLVVMDYWSTQGYLLMDANPWVPLNSNSKSDYCSKYNYCDQKFTAHKCTEKFISAQSHNAVAWNASRHEGSSMNNTAWLDRKAELQEIFTKNTRPVIFWSQ